MNAKDLRGSTPLHFAAENTRRISRTIAALLGAGADVNARDLGGSTPLHVAVGDGNTYAVTALLDAGADPNAEGDHSLTPLHWAARAGDAAAVAALLDAGADPNAEGIFGVRIGDDSIGATGYITFTITPLHGAAAHGSTALITALVNACADPNTVEPVSDLIEAFLEPHDSYNRGIMEEEIFQLFEFGEHLSDWLRANSGDHNATLLHVAARNGDTAAIAALLDAGADPNAREKRDDLGLGNGGPLWGGTTPLHTAAGNGHTAAIATLLDAGADPNATDGDGYTPLQLADREGHVAAVFALPAAGATE